VVDGTVIVVADGHQHEQEIPAGDARAFINHGVLTIELSEIEGDN